MTNPNTTYKRLGDYIREVDVRNSAMEVNLSQGICNMKYFQNPRQVSSTPHLDKIVRTGQFAYNRATTRNGNKISIAYREGPDCTVSSAYCVFYITDEEVLNPYYLWLWFKRPDFDRYAIFKSHGSAHEFFEFETLCNTYVPIPSIEVQRQIVSNYLAIQHRIATNKQTIAKLEEAAQALYRKMFVDNIDPENLPAGWRKQKLIDVADIQYGFAFNGNLFNSEGKGMPIIRIRNIPSGCTNDYTTEMTSNKYIVKSGDILIGMDGDFHINQWLGKDAYLVQRSCSVRPKKDIYLGYIYQAILEPIKKFQDSIVGATVIHLSKKNLDEIEIIMPTEYVCVKFQTLRYHIYKKKCDTNLLNTLLTNMRF